MNRFRLQLPRQQIELLPGETRIGRSPTCAVTIEDPLISREHGLIRVTEDEVTYEDLASRNGSRINGELVYMPVPLRHGDLIGIGKHELRFLVATEGIRPLANRSTGVMRSCSRCGLPYSADRGSCPHCASEDYIEEAPPTEQSSDRGWMLEMLGEMLERALSLGSIDDVRRVFRRVTMLLEEHRAGGVPIGDDQIERFLRQAERADDLEEAAKLRDWAKDIASREGRE